MAPEWKRRRGAAAPVPILAEPPALNDRSRFRVYTLLLTVYAARLQKYDDAEQAGKLAEALLQRLGDDPALAAHLHCAQAHAEWYRGNYEEALAAA